jgi:nucleoside-diphosphate-sugar epimerase
MFPTPSPDAPGNCSTGCSRECGRREAIVATALITGGTGFVGSHLVRSLVRGGDDVHLIVRPSSDLVRLHDVMGCIRLHRGDVLDLSSVAAAVHAARPDYVFHLAGAGSVGGAAAAPGDLVTVNLLGTANLLKACEAVAYRGLVTTGDAFEYAPGVRPLRESDACEPLSLHGISKFAATLHARATARAHGRPIVTLRLFSVYGPDDNPARLIPRAIAAALSGRAIPLSWPTVVRDWAYIDDVVALYVEASRKAGSLARQVFNVGTGRGTELASLVDTILRLTGSAAEPRWDVFPESVHDTHPWVADMTRSFDTFAWRPAVCLEKGLHRTIAAMVVHEQREKAAREA